MIRRKVDHRTNSSFLEGFIQNDPMYLPTDSPDFFDVGKFGLVFFTYNGF
jgi:hypothetical protein